MDGLGMGWHPERGTFEAYLHPSLACFRANLGAQSSLRLSSTAHSRGNSWGNIVALMRLICSPPM